MRKTDDNTILEMLKDGKTQKEIAAHFGVSPAAICKRVKRLLPPPESLQELTEKEQAFAVAIIKRHDPDGRCHDGFRRHFQGIRKKSGLQFDGETGHSGRGR